MNLSVNGHSKVPPGFRFHPTEEELLQYYLKKKVAFESIDLDVIRDIDLNKLEPWDIQEECRIGSGTQNDWYFFSHKDKKYPTGTRTNRATAAGFWKATGRDKMIYSNSNRIGMRKTLVFYKGRAPHGEKSDWIMHEYRLEDCSTTNNTVQHDLSCVSREDNCIAEEGWVICRVFRKKNYQKANESPKSLPISTESQSQLINFSDKKVLDHIFSCMGKTYQDENNHDHSTTSSTTSTNIFPTYSCCTGKSNPNTPKERSIIHDDNHNNNNNNNNMTKGYSNQVTLNSQLLEGDDDQYSLPMLSSSSPPFDHHPDDGPMIDLCYDHQRLMEGDPKPRLSDWMTLDRLIASQLNGQDEELICSNSVMFQSL